MSRDLEEKIKKTINNLQFNGQILSELNVINGMKLHDNTAYIILNRHTNENLHLGDLKTEIENKLSKIIEQVKFIETSDKPENKKLKFSDIKNLVLISSGKGGVGKSTITYCLAQSLSKMGKKVGILDADILGPSIPLIANIQNEPKINEAKFEPIEKNGIKYNSVGFLIPKGKSLVWRGPMVTKALHKLFLDTNWGKLDYLFVDMPPGTGDVHLTICSKYHVDSVIMVTTPSKLAIEDVERAEDMYNKLSLTNRHKICNMAYFESNAGSKSYPFGKSDEKFQVGLVEGREQLEEIEKQLKQFSLLLL